MRRFLSNPKPPGVRSRPALAALGILCLLTSLLGLQAVPAEVVAPARFLEDLQRAAVRYFLEQCDAETGFARDRAPADGSTGRAPSSVAATGFALTAWCVADAHGWLRPGEALLRVRRTLEALTTVHARERGWFYHFVDARSGARVWDCEVSTIDTALLLQGAVMAREYLRDDRVAALVDGLYRDLDWTWARQGALTLTHGWTPERGFLRARWDAYAESMGLYLLGLGAPARALPVASWHAWTRGPVVRAGGRSFFGSGSLFTHQYSHAWFDFRGRRDAHGDYFENSVQATLAQRDWSAAQSDRYPHWSREVWGLTASDSVHGYTGWGRPVPLRREDDTSDGTLVPCAPAGSLPFAPAECLVSLLAMRRLGGDRVWGRYGFADAFNPQTGWVAKDVIGIDVGITLLMAENLRTGLVWRTFMQAPEVQRAMALAGFRRTDGEVPGAVLATLLPGAAGTP